MTGVNQFFNPNFMFSLFLRWMVVKGHSSVMRTRVLLRMASKQEVETPLIRIVN